MTRTKPLACGAGEAERASFPKLLGLRLVLVAFVSSAFGLACDASSPAPDGGDGDAGDADGGSDGERDAEPDGPTADGSREADVAGDAGRGAGYSGEDVALAATAMTFTTERLCDLDGDGIGNNAIAELGEPGASSAVMLWNALAEVALGDRYGPGLFFPVLEDGGESVLIALSGDGATLGDELRAPYESMDGCGEPTFAYRGGLVHGGQLTLSAPEYPVLLSDGMAAGSARVTGRLSVDEGPVSLETEECIAPTIQSLGRAFGPTQTRGLSLLEALLAGGSALGVAGVPGLAPDTDLDGDGLERVVLDGDGRVEACIDGDNTVVVGRDCWADERMADAFSLTRRVRYDATTFAGRFEGWLGRCDEGHARPSLFGAEWSFVGAWQIALGDYHSCRLSPDGAVQCWGEAERGQLGYGNVQDIGDDEPACVGGEVDLGEPALWLAATAHLTCAITEGRRLKCWGDVGEGLPLIGDDETPAAGAYFELGVPVQQVVAGNFHYCAVLSGGRVRCWGLGTGGWLGHGNVESLTIEEAAIGADVPVGGRVVSLAAGGYHTCALLEGGSVRCWGLGIGGWLGYGNDENVGDDETPVSVGDVDLGGPALEISAGAEHTCAVLEGGGIRCWGRGLYGQLGYANVENVGDDETPASVGDVDVGGMAVAVRAGAVHTCAVLESGRARCWGAGGAGQLGYGSSEDVGDDEAPSAAGDVDVGGIVAGLDLGYAHTCALLENGRVRCWGAGEYGRLGYGDADVVGDDETPASAGDVPLTCEP